MFWVIGQGQEGGGGHWWWPCGALRHVQLLWYLPLRSDERGASDIEHIVVWRWVSKE